MRTQVVIIGAGPAGLLLSQLLHLAEIERDVARQHDTHGSGRKRLWVEGYFVKTTHSCPPAVKDRRTDPNRRPP